MNIIWGVIVAVITGFAIRKMLKKKDLDDLPLVASEKSSGVRTPYEIPAIKPSKERIEWEKKGQALAFDYMQAKFSKDGYIRSGCVNDIVDRIKKETAPFQWGRLETTFQGGPLLTVEEKKKVGLPTRRKYYKEFVEMFHLDMKPGEDPRNYVQMVMLTGMNKGARAISTWQGASMGIDKFTIRCPDHCALHGKLEGQKVSVDSIPELPPSGCTGGYCGCYLEAVIPM